MAAGKVVLYNILFCICFLGIVETQLEICGPFFNQCDRDEFLVHDKRMLLISQEKNWEDARAHCKLIGMNLLATTTRQEVEDLWHYLSNRVFGVSHVEVQSWNLWLDATDHEAEGVWKWTETGENVTYKPWFADEPNGGVLENCLELWGNGEDRTLWNDAKCHQRRRFICEISDYGLN